RTALSAVPNHSMAKSFSQPGVMSMNVSPTATNGVVPRAKAPATSSAAANPAARASTPANAERQRGVCGVLAEGCGRVDGRDEVLTPRSCAAALIDDTARA